MSKSESSPAWFIPWRRNGFLRKETAQQWLDRGFTSEEAGPWYHLDVDSPDVAAHWVANGLGPGDYVRWSSVGHGSPELVDPWRALKIPFESAKEWITVGVGQPDVVVKCNKLGITAKDWGACREVASRKRCEEWLDYSETADWLSSATRSQWMRKGIEPAIAHAWIYLGIQTEESARLEGIGFDCGYFLSLGENEDAIELAQLALSSSSVEQFQYVIEKYFDTDRELALRSGIPEERLREWAGIESISLTEIVELEELKISPPDIQRWRSVVDSNIYSLISLMKDHVSFLDAIFWKSAGLTADEISLVRNHLTMDSFNQLRDSGFSNQEILGITDRENSKSEVDYFLDNACLKDHQLEMTSFGISREEIPAWWFLAQGKIEQIKPWRDQKISLADIDEVTRSSKLVVRLSDASMWKSNGHSIRQALKLIREGKNPFFYKRATPIVLSEYPSAVARRNSSALTQFTFGWISKNVDQATEEWYERIFSLAYFLKSNIRKELSYDHEFENSDSDFSLKISLRRDKVHVLLRDVSGDKESFTFDPGQIYLLSDVKPARQRLVAGLGLSWFLDWSVVCDGRNGNLGSAKFPIRRATEPSKFRSSCAYRYVGISQRDLNYSSITGSRNTSPIFHQVAGFVRELPDGWSPSAEARNNAPGYIRKSLKPNETWVRPHARGSEVGIIIERLRQSSVLAIALGGL
jgi:hypothetical protein